MSMGPEPWNRSTRPMRVVIVGLGVQGEKRRRIAGSDVVATVDPVHPQADFQALDQVPPGDYDAALLCIPDAPKLGLIETLLDSGKHVLVEKPLFADSDDRLDHLRRLAVSRGVTCYTAYNHRFEPHIAALKSIIEAGTLGPLYRARFFYGNGTARDVRDSAWRDSGAGVLPDLGSHLLDMTLFLFGRLPADLTVWAARRFENRCYDHVVCGSRDALLIEYEMSLLSWRNHFTAEIVGEHGTAQIASLCKWGPSTLTLHRRILPSGRPVEESRTLVEPDPTWAAEYDHFKALCAEGASGNLANDVLINGGLKTLIDAADRLAATP
jgi:scyllo-inositol 2-dehydrogenase (NADP+)